MSENISQSNARLRAVSKPKSDTTKNVSSSNRVASGLASSRDQGASSVGSTDQSFKKSVNNLSKNATKPRASFEGYMYAPSAHIQVSGHGYDNVKHQTARNKSMSPRANPKEFNSKSINLQSNMSNSGIINNYTKCSLTNSSKSILDKALKINKSF